MKYFIPSALLGFLSLLTIPTVNADAPFRKISRIELKPVFHRRFKQPVFVTPYPGRIAACPDAYAIVEKRGVVRIESMDQKCGLVLADLRDRVAAPTLEEGLLGLAFPPNFRESGSYFVYYSAANPRRTILARLDMTGKMGVGKNRVTELLTIRQPISNHNGGMLMFGPDGYLYLGVGHGGSGGDPRGYAQNTASHLGKLLRI
ncbi:MAG TPA: PQQ-dependent sugar dehydrogenase, partial [Turneriella sp.]|nr:PQQ-dependent sugar dehydrogenase [Turneriella sp.]